MSRHIYEEGYSTQELLDIIRNYNPSENMNIVEFLMTHILPYWWGGDGQYKLHRKYNGVQKLVLHTGGWSGNEDIVGAILSNIYLTHFSMTYVMWKAGGHFYFEIKDRKS